MSLINDALKQASQSQSKTPPPGAPPLPPLEVKREPPSPWPLMVAIIFFAVAILIFVISNHLKQKNALPQMTNAPAPALAKTEPPPPTNISAKPATNINMTATNAPAQAAERLPQVQGIIDDAARPVAIVDRKTLRVGDRDGDFKVIAISRNAVTFQCADGSFKEIQLGEQ